MDDEHERQRRDLQRATRLLETMPREELVEMLLDILSNERSEDTRKLSDWMAFQIILHDETRRGRELLAQLGKGGRNHRWSQISQTPSASHQCPTLAGQDSRLHDHALEDASSSTGSFATCPEAEPSNAIQPKDEAAEEGPPAAAQVINGKLQDATVTKVDEKHDHGDTLASSKSDKNNLGRAGAKPTLKSWMLRWCDPILRQKPRAPPEPITSREESPQPKAFVTPVPPRPQPITARDSFGPRLHRRGRGSGQVRQRSPEVKSIGETNEAGHKNLAELYARYEKAQEEVKNADHVYECNETTTDGSDVSASDQALEEMQKYQCRFCNLYYSPEQNLRDLDNGRSPCSFHPGEVKQGGAIKPTATDSRHAWTCCRRAVSDDELKAGSARTPGCVNIYHREIDKVWCRICGRPFTDEDNDVQPDGSSPCSYHPASRPLDLDLLSSQTSLKIPRTPYPQPDSLATNSILPNQAFVREQPVKTAAANVTMSDSPPHDTGDGVPSPPTNQHRGIDVQTLRDLVQTEEGAATLAEALKDRRVRDVLKQHGVKVQTNDDVGYNSLPFELRDKIRRCTIALLEPGEVLHQKCQRCPRLAPYACIDLEWQQAVESTTFRYLALQGGNKATMNDFKLFESYVVGRRRKYLRHISLSAPGTHSLSVLSGRGTPTGEDAEGWIDALFSLVHQVFNCLEQWSKNGTSQGNLALEIQTTRCGSPSTMRRVSTGLSSLPTVPQITHFSAPLWAAVDMRSMLALVSHMPNLQSATMVLDFSRQPQDAASSEIQQFFDFMSQTVPGLEALEVKCRTHRDDDELQKQFCAKAFLYSQRLRKLSLSMESHSDFVSVRSILAPFSTSSFDPNAKPPLLWPNLTQFKIEGWAVAHPYAIISGRETIAYMLNEHMLTVGRIISAMPCIQNLEIGWTYPSAFDQHGQGSLDLRGDTNITLEIESLRGPHGHIPLAKLSVTHEDISGDFAATVPSAEVRGLWEESLLQAANATLDIQVVLKNDRDKAAFDIWDFDP